MMGNKSMQHVNSTFMSMLWKFKLHNNERHMQQANKALNKTSIVASTSLTKQQLTGTNKQQQQQWQCQQQQDTRHISTVVNIANNKQLRSSIISTILHSVRFWRKTCLQEEELWRGWTRTTTAACTGCHVVNAHFPLYCWLTSSTVDKTEHKWQWAHPWPRSSAGKCKQVSTLTSCLFLKVLEESGVCSILQNVLLWITATVPPPMFLRGYFCCVCEWKDNLQLPYVWDKESLAKVQGSPQGRKNKE